ncbi:MAG: 2-amino-4-hydroxy-6-hydroxymethyldihydropteridine diphosphokinase, partial [Roseiflexus sp.]|nr:2-amino-4-hydroxy-6-hydroxymethyldihydropteridine diphosphokinase [Roseiflexus sp.]
MAQHETTVYIGLGSNIGDRVARLRESVVRLSQVIKVTRASRLYVQAPLGYVSQH